MSVEVGVRLEEVELQALKYLFDDEPGLAKLCVDIENFVVQARELTTVGFYSIINCKLPSGTVGSSREISKKISDPLLATGGCYVCWIEHDFTLCLEGFSDRNWPKALTPRALQ
ncbi:hypothetical protein [Pseudomonas sp. H9]|uniref:hypothetical protein n=1 Tax=Pseudomonas sp. H9 TaxID=483968 RepID=UPI0010576BFD|nr:hypothetical protein [Pseudomonas sp. H9]TDF86202.1 hypothetical protein E1573_01130 [Pseudomonas sp. H9]